MRYLLNETVNAVRKQTDHDIRTQRGFFSSLADPDSFRIYAKTLAEGLNESDRRAFLVLAKNARKHILESVSSSANNLTNYESLVIPILRNFMPKLISKELVNVMPIDKPEVIRPFLKPYFRRPTIMAGGDAGYSGYDYEFPSINQDISRGPEFTGMNGSSYVAYGFVDLASMTAGGLDILALHDLTPAEAHIEKDFTITGVSTDSGYTWIESGINIRTTVDGNFSVTVAISEGVTDVISGHVDFKNGKIVVSSAAGVVDSIKYKAFLSLEENHVNPTVEMRMEKITLKVVDRRITGIWTTNLETDAKALYDVSVQSELANVMGEQIALDTDREIINDLITIVETRNTNHIVKFPKNYSSTNYAHGPKEWYGQVIPCVNMLAAKISDDTQMGVANVLACNPLDAAIFESLNSFEYLGDATAGGDVGYRSATVASGKYKLLVSSLVPKGKVITKYRSDDETRAAYLFAPYVPAMMVPYPLGANPSMSIISRYATQVIREKAVGYVNVTEDVAASDWAPTFE